MVILQGVVGARLAKRAAGDDCWDTLGVTDVSNQLEVLDADESDADPQAVSDIMTACVVALEGTSPLRAAAEVMRDEDIGSVVVTDGGHLTGIVTDRNWSSVPWRPAETRRRRSSARSTRSGW